MFIIRDYLKIEFLFEAPMDEQSCEFIMCSRSTCIRPSLIVLVQQEKTLTGALGIPYRNKFEHSMCYTGLQILLLVNQGDQWPHPKYCVEGIQCCGKRKKNKARQLFADFQMLKPAHTPSF